MMEKFYCVGCKNHHELEVLEATEQNGKGGSIRYSLRSVCPSGHKTNKLCKREIYEAYGAEVSEMAAEGMTVGVNLEALAPTADEPESGVALVPADSLMPEGSGRTIGSQSVSHNYTPFHAEIAYAVSWEGKEDNNEGLIYGIEYIDEVGGVADVEWFSTAEERDEELTRYLEKYGAESNKDEDGNYISCPKCGYEPPVYEIGEECLMVQSSKLKMKPTKKQFSGSMKITQITVRKVGTLTKKRWMLKPLMPKLSSLIRNSKTISLL